MKTPNELMDPVQTRGDFRRLSESAHDATGRSSEYPDLPEDHPLWEVWQTLSEIFSSFVSLYGEQPSWGWLGVLGDLSAADLGQGVMAIRDNPGEFPPNASEFFQMCRPELPQQRRQRVGKAPKELPFNPTKEFKLEQIRKLREEHGL